VLGWVALGVVGVGALRVAQSQQAPSGPPSPAAAEYLPPEPAPGSVFARPIGGSVPVRIDIPDVEIHAVLIKVGLQADGSVGVPPLDQAQRAAWYDGSPSPGEAGPSIIDGHVDSRETRGFRGAFYNLGRIQPGEHIEITRSDHVVATFTVDSVQQAPKAKFPTSRVYGSVPYAALRLITCGGDFDYARGSYKDNTIVYAHMTDTTAN
jgi:sortase (surface protein transpeptidase)